MVRSWRGTMVLVGLLQACSGATGEPTRAPDTPADPAAPTSGEAAPGAPEGAPEAGPSAAAPAEEPAADPGPEAPPPAGVFELAPEQAVAKVADRFVLWGWSGDSERYAFSTYSPGQGGRACDDSVEFFVVDAGRDAFVKGAYAEHAYGPEGDEVCPEPHPHRAHDEALPARLAEHGIIEGQVGTRLALAPAGEGRWSVALPGGTGELAFWVTGDARPAEGQEGNGYRAVLSLGGEQLVVEPGTRRRDWIWDYAPQALFLAPDGAHGLLVVERQGMGYEATHFTFMTNGFVLPEAMR